MKISGLQLRLYCYVLDFVSSILTVLLNWEYVEAYNISNKNLIITIRQLAEIFANISRCKILYKNSGDIELSGYNTMKCSALDSTKLENLGWRGMYNIELGVKSTISILKQNNIF